MHRIGVAGPQVQWWTGYDNMDGGIQSYWAMTAFWTYESLSRERSRSQLQQL